MACDQKLEDQVRKALAHIPDVAEKHMFGSLGFMVRGKLCLSAREERLMCRIDPTLHEEVIKKAGCHTVVMKGRERRGYVYIDRDALKTGSDLQHWVDLALAYNAEIS